MNSQEWGRYVRHVIGSDNQPTVAAKVGVDQTVVGRWKKGMVPSPANVGSFAQEYGRDILEAFVAASFMSADQAPTLSEESRALLRALFAGDPLPGEEADEEADEAADESSQKGA
jgi:hypothetical protein